MCCRYFDDVFERDTGKPRPYIGRRASTRSIDARSDFETEDGEERAQRERDDAQVLEYVNRRLQHRKSISGRSDASMFDVDDEEFAAQLDEN